MKLVFLYSTIKMMHGPINIRFIVMINRFLGFAHSLVFQKEHDGWEAEAIFIFTSD